MTNSRTKLFYRKKNATAQDIFIQFSRCSARKTVSVTSFLFQSPSKTETESASYSNSLINKVNFVSICKISACDLTTTRSIPHDCLTFRVAFHFFFIEYLQVVLERPCVFWTFCDTQGENQFWPQRTSKLCNTLWLDGSVLLWLKAGSVERHEQHWRLSSIETFEGIKKGDWPQTNQVSDRTLLL